MKHKIDPSILAPLQIIITKSKESDFTVDVFPGISITFGLLSVSEGMAVAEYCKEMVKQYPTREYGAIYQLENLVAAIRQINSQNVDHEDLIEVKEDSGMELLVVHQYLRTLVMGWPEEITSGLIAMLQLKNAEMNMLVLNSIKTSEGVSIPDLLKQVSSATDEQLKAVKNQERIPPEQNTQPEQKLQKEPDVVDSDAGALDDPYKTGELPPLEAGMVVQHAPEMISRPNSTEQELQRMEGTYPFPDNRTAGVEYRVGQGLNKFADTIPPLSGTQGIAVGERREPKEGSISSRSEFIESPIDTYKKERRRR
jgi:hypothetical protein